MATSYSMVVGGGLLTVGIFAVLVSWLYLRDISLGDPGASTFLILFASGLLFCTVGLFFVFFTHIRHAEI
ncbi:MAG: hypothetical protein JRN15_23075 [Nitrososphaerota archaeon]|nr:hypothetical protein [Nitrososphaerota archaeon]